MGDARRRSPRGGGSPAPAADSSPRASSPQQATSASRPPRSRPAHGSSNRSSSGSAMSSRATSSRLRSPSERVASSWPAWPAQPTNVEQLVGARVVGVVVGRPPRFERGVAPITTTSCAVSVGRSRCSSALLASPMRRRARRGRRPRRAVAEHGHGPGRRPARGTRAAAGSTSCPIRSARARPSARRARGPVHVVQHDACPARRGRTPASSKRGSADGHRRIMPGPRAPGPAQRAWGTVDRWRRRRGRDRRRTQRAGRRQPARRRRLARARARGAARARRRGPQRRAHPSRLRARHVQRVLPARRGVAGHARARPRVARPALASRTARARAPDRRRPVRGPRRPTSTRPRRSLDEFAPGDGDAWRALDRRVRADQRAAARRDDVADPAGQGAGPAGRRARARGACSSSRASRCCRCGGSPRSVRGRGRGAAPRRQRHARRPRSRRPPERLPRLVPHRPRPAVRVSRSPRAAPAS